MAEEKENPRKMVLELTTEALEELLRMKEVLGLRTTPEVVVYALVRLSSSTQGQRKAEEPKKPNLWLVKSDKGPID